MKSGDGPAKPNPYDLARAAKAKLKDIPESYWTDNERKVASFSDTSRIKPDPKFEDETNVTVYDFGKGRRKTIPYNEMKPSDKQITFPSSNSVTSKGKKNGGPVGRRTRMRPR